MSNKIPFYYKKKEITVARGVGYGLTDLMGGGWNNIVSGVIFTFLAFQGFDPAIAGAITGIARIFDSIFSLFIGSITDGFYKTKLGQKYGRRHFFMFSGIIFFAVLFPLFWINNVDETGKPNFLYYCVLYTAIEIVIAFILIPWETLPTEMTIDYTKRTILSGSRMFISATGTTVVFAVQAILQNMDNPDAYLITGIIYTILFVVAMFISYATTWEFTPEELENIPDKPKTGLFTSLGNVIKDYFSTFKNKAFRKHLSVYLLSFTGKDFYSTLLPTFIVYACLMKNGDPWTLNAFAFMGIPATLLASYLMIKKGPKFLYTWAYTIMILSMVGYIFVYATKISSPLLIMIVITAFYQFGRAVLEFTPWNVFPFIPDVDYIMTREKRAGVYAAVMTFFRKSTGALASFVAGVLLQTVGWHAAPKTIGDTKCTNECIENWAKSPDYNYDSVSFGIATIFFVGTVVLIVGALIIAQVFRLNKDSHAILKNEIDRLENGGSKEDVSSDAKRVCEALTGHKYETLWPELND